MDKKPWEPPSAGKVAELWTSCVDDMLDVRRSFQMNDAFFHGEQWVSWSDSTGNVEIEEFATAAEANARATVNEFQPRVTTFMARLLSTPLTFEPRPKGVDSEAIRRARLEASVLDAKAHRGDWEAVRREAMYHTTMGGVSAVAVEPDWTYEDDGPVFDSDTGDRVRLPSAPHTTLTALSPGEFGVEPGSRTSEQARWWIRATTLSPEQAQEEYDLEEPPAKNAARYMSAMGRALLKRRRNNVVQGTTVLVYYERPTKVSPGCVLHIVGEKVVRQSAWPFPFKRINLVPFRMTDLSGTWMGGTVADSARRLQVQINRCHTSIQNHVGKADSARLAVPLGSMLDGDDDFTGDPAEVIRWDPAAGGGPPQWISPPQLARWLDNQLDRLENKMDDTFFAHQVTRGIAPGDRNSGLALSILAEKDETPLSLMSTNQQKGWQTLAEMVLQTERKLLTALGESYGQVGMELGPMSDVLPSPQNPSDVQEVEWSAEDLSEHPIVHVPLTKVMPTSKAATQEAFLKFAAVPAFATLFAQMDASQIADVLQVPDPTAFAIIADPQAAEAEWENGRMAKGVGDEEVQVREWQDHDKHVQSHNKYRSSAAYRNAPPEVQEFADLHVQAHAKVALDQMMARAQQMQSFTPADPMVGQPDPAGELPAGEPPAAGVPA